MVRYAVVSIASGILFAVLDGLINANPFAQKLLQVFRPISRTSINVPAGILIDLAYGFVMAGAFLLLFGSLPGESGWLKGVSFAVLVWFFRVVMYVASQWMMLKIPVGALAYLLVAGFGEMLALGIVYGLSLETLALELA